MHGVETPTQPYLVAGSRWTRISYWLDFHPSNIHVTLTSPPLHPQEWSRQMPFCQSVAFILSPVILFQRLAEKPEFGYSMTRQPNASASPQDSRCGRSGCLPCLRRTASIKCTFVCTVIPKGQFHPVNGIAFRSLPIAQEPI